MADETEKPDTPEPPAEPAKGQSGSDGKKRRSWWFRIPIYHRIFLGMVLGVAVGLVLGPRSGLLHKDRIRTADAEGLELRSGAGDEADRVKPGVAGALELKILARAKVGEAQWYRVEWTEAAKKTGKKTQKNTQKNTTKGKGEPRKRTAWLKVDSAPLPTSHVGHTVMDVLSPVGRIFMRLIKMVVVPLVFASLLVGVFSLGDLRKLGRFGGKTVVYYLATTAVAVTIGLLLANTIKPGRYVGSKQRKQLTSRHGKKVTEVKEKPARAGLSDRIVEIVPENPLTAAVKADMLQIIFFALFFGIVLRLLPGEGPGKLVGFFETVNDALIKAVELIMELAPFGVLALLAEVVGASGFGVLMALGVYCVVVLVGLTAHVAITYSAAVKLFTPLGVWRFLKAARKAQLIAFSTSSSAATLPVTMRVAERDLGVSRQASSFVLPLGATINMDGTALYQAVAAVFTAQVFGMDLTLAQQLTILLTATLASVGAAGVPSAGIIMLIMVLSAAGLPEAGVALILGVDRLLDMFRTAVNVTGDLSAVAIVATSEGEKLKVVEGGSGRPGSE